MGEVITAAAIKGGVGKTSLITNIAGILSKQKKKILIIDVDGQENVSDAFNLTKTSVTMTEVLLKGVGIEDAITEYNKYIDIVQAGEGIFNLEFHIFTNIDKYPNPFFILKGALSTIRDKYDYIFIDTPPSFGLAVGNAIFASDKVIIPFVPDRFAVKGLYKIIKAIKDLDKQNPANIHAVIPLMVESRTSLHSQLLKHAREFCNRSGYMMTKTVIPKTIRFSSAVAYENKPATLTRDAIAVHQYSELVKEIFGNGQKR